MSRLRRLLDLALSGPLLHVLYAVSSAQRMILPPLTRFRMVILPTVGCASLTHGWDTITALRFYMVCYGTVG